MRCIVIIRDGDTRPSDTGNRGYRRIAGAETLDLRRRLHGDGGQLHHIMQLSVYAGTTSLGHLLQKINIFSKRPHTVNIDRSDKIRFSRFNL